ncbi:MAG TPA: SURF1 family protein [Rugosimonospora sp.]|nr:SURF1 family protein [Rugosimonospora sp.]
MSETVGVTRTALWRVAVRPRMLGLLALLLAAAVVCGLLGAWQLDRARERGEAAQRARQASLAAAAPVPLDSVLAPQTAFPGDAVGRKVSVTGTYEADGQLLVTGRAHDGATGSLVLTPLRVGTGAGAAVLPVVRGWLPAGGTADPPPGGPVSVVGYLQAGESAGAGIAGTTTDAISPAELLHVWDGPIWSGYLVLASSSPSQPSGLALLDPPTPTETGPNLQNLLYAVEWFVFGGFAVFIWWRAVLDEAHGRRRDRS